MVLGSVGDDDEELGGHVGGVDRGEDSARDLGSHLAESEAVRHERFTEAARLGEPTEKHVVRTASGAQIWPRLGRARLHARGRAENRSNGICACPARLALPGSSRSPASRLAPREVPAGRSTLSFHAWRRRLTPVRWAKDATPSQTFVDIYKPARDTVSGEAYSISID